MTSGSDLQKRAVLAEKNHQWAEAAELFLRLAHSSKDSKSFESSAAFFMRAAIAFERDEEWRKIGHIWLQCAAALECRSQSAVTDTYDFLEASKHFFPTLDLHAWTRFSQEEKLGRALRNAAYHLEKAGSNQSAYTQYRQAGDAFRSGGILDEASRCYYLALTSFINKHGELDAEILESLEVVNRSLMRDDEIKYFRRVRVYYRRLASALNDSGNYPEASELFCKEAEIARRLSLRQHSMIKWLAYTFWKWTSHYGNSSVLWSCWAVLLFIVVFPIAFALPGNVLWRITGRLPNGIDFVYLSLATVTTAPDLSFDVTTSGKCIAMVEGLLGFFMLGSLLSIVVKRFAR